MSEALTTLSPEQARRLSALFEAHSDRLYRLARRLVPSADAALDLVQETYLKAARASRHVPDGARDEEAWLVRILVNVRRDQWRREGVRRNYESQVKHRVPEYHDPETALLIQASIWSALDHLAPRRRAVIVMHEIEGLSMPSIASLLGINTITVRWHLSRGRRELRQLLNCDFGGTDERESQEPVAQRRPNHSGSTAS